MWRPWQVWLAFGLCSLVVAGAMGRLTSHALRVDRERSAARAEAELEQRVSLALWRMDTKLAPLIAEEVARPYLHYDSFITLQAPSAKGEAPVQWPSPLLTGRSANVLLNFDASLDGQWRSPQCPTSELRPLAGDNGLSAAEIDVSCQRLERLAESVDVRELAAKLPEQPLPQLAVVPGKSPLESQRMIRPPGDAGAGDASFYSNFSDVTGELQAYGLNQAAGAAAAATQSQRQTPRQAVELAQQRSYGDLTERNSRFQQAAQEEFAKQRADNRVLLQGSSTAPAAVIENVSRPLWVGEQLLLARRVVRDGQTFVQGSWLDWPRLKADLLAETSDLLPQADLAPVRGDEQAEPTRMLAGLPLQLVVADSAAALAAGAAVDGALQWALGVGWAALVMALAAVAALLWGVLALSERRAAFVSSVTHELRTPLTTFRMYAEMLAKDMIPSPERRREYLETLKTEAERLTHLVENVLSYARLERGRRPKRQERTTPAALVERFCPRLAERAARSDMELACQVDPAAAVAELVTDVGVVEQILFNLVDNAAKYAGRAEDRRIHLEVARDRSAVTFAVRDYGPGFASLRSAERSAPFSKSAQEAAESAPGVGLGLALCRRLARDLGGRLEIQAKNGCAAGACVTLRLPAED